MNLSSGFRAAKCALALALAGSLALTSGSYANEISNGSFENGTNPGTITNLPNGSTAITNWVVSRGNVDYVGNIWLAEDGSRSVGLNGTAAGGVSQTFNTYAGALYGVSFCLSGDPFTSEPMKHLRVTAAGASVDYTYDASVAWFWDMHWELATWSFTANSNSTTLEFYSLDAGDYGPAIDSVDVTVLSDLGVDGGPLADFALSPISPNPSSGPARVDYTVPREAPVRVSVFDVAGREVAVLADGPHRPGRYGVRWDGNGARGGAGLYFIRLQAPGRSLTQRLALIR